MSVGEEREQAGREVPGRENETGGEGEGVPQDHNNAHGLGGMFSVLLLLFVI